MSSNLKKMSMFLVLALVVSSQAMGAGIPPATLTKMIQGIQPSSALDALGVIKNMKGLSREASSALSTAGDLKQLESIAKNLNDEDLTLLVKTLARSHGAFFKAGVVDEAEASLKNEIGRTGDISTASSKVVAGNVKSEVNVQAVQADLKNEAATTERVLDLIDDLSNSEGIKNDFNAINTVRKMGPDLKEQDELAGTTILSGKNGEVCDGLTKAGSEIVEPLGGFVRNATESVRTAIGKCKNNVDKAFFAAFYNWRKTARNGDLKAVATDMKEGCGPCGFCGIFSSNPGLISRMTDKATKILNGVSVGERKNFQLEACGI